MTKAQIITKAQLYLDDTSELSTQEFSDLFDKMYNVVNSAHTWESTKAEGTGTTSASVASVALATGFLYFTANNNYTDASNEAGRPVIYRGANYTPYKIVSWSDRRQYRNSEGYAYVDFANSLLYFTKQPTVVEAVEYDYHMQQAALATGASPWFPVEFHDAIYHLMVSDDFMIQASDKAKSYAAENRAAAEQFIDRMKYWNSQLVQI